MPRILVVDDEVIITMLMEDLLTSLGHVVAGVASSGKKAVALAHDLKPDLILMDIVMPGELDGIDAAKKIKSELDIPVVFITGHTEEELVNRAKQAEPLGYIVKPLDKSQIGAAIDIALHKKETERQLKKAYEELEQQVQERTASLVEAKEQLEIKTTELEETNAALKVLLRQRTEDKDEFEAKLISNVKKLILPYLEELKRMPLDPKQETYLKILDTNLKEITLPFSRRLSAKYLNLTPKEIQVADLIKQGNSTKEIAEFLHSTKWTIDFHRKNLRHKFGLKNRKANLRSYLLTLS